MLTNRTLADTLAELDRNNPEHARMMRAELANIDAQVAAAAAKRPTPAVRGGNLRMALARRKLIVLASDETRAAREAACRACSSFRLDAQGNPTCNFKTCGMCRMTDAWALADKSCFAQPAKWGPESFTPIKQTNPDDQGASKLTAGAGDYST